MKAPQKHGARVLVNNGAALRRLCRYTSHELADRFGFATALEAIPKRSSRLREIVRRRRRKAAPALIRRRALRFRKAKDGQISIRFWLASPPETLQVRELRTRPELSNLQSFWGRCEPKSDRNLTIFGFPEAQRASSDQSRCRLAPPPPHNLPKPR